MDNGQRVHVLVEDTKLSERVVRVWADPGYTKLIESIKGVTNVFQDDDAMTKYTVYIDGRFDPIYIKGRIYSVILAAMDVEDNENER